MNTTSIEITAFKWVPPFAQGLVRDLRVRWALEEAGLPYSEKLLAAGEQGLPEHRAVQPFGQVPVYREGDLTLFESGAIVMHIAQKSPALLPVDAAGRARAMTWMFAALNSVETHVVNLVHHRPVLCARGVGETASARRRENGARPAGRSRHGSRHARVSREHVSRPAICS